MNLKNFALLATMTFFYGCSTAYYQVVETKTTNTKVVNDKYVFENDSLKITYNFWKEKGLLEFTVYNKLKKPLYIDWKKSSYINNTVKINYWEDEEKTKTVSVHSSSTSIPRGSLYAFTNSSSISSSSTIKPEKLTFVPPSSNYTRKQFYLAPSTFIKIPAKDYKEEKVADLKDPTKQVTVYVKDFEKNDTPLIFRNFLTLSYSEKFDSEFYLDHEFYISRVRKMEKKQLGVNKYDRKREDLLRDEDGKVKIFSPYEKGTSFYVYMFTR